MRIKQKTISQTPARAKTPSNLGHASGMANGGRVQLYSSIAEEEAKRSIDDSRFTKSFDPNSELYLHFLKYKG